MTTPPIILVPGFWLGVGVGRGRRPAPRRRPRGHRADAAGSRVGRRRPLRHLPVRPCRRDLRGGDSAGRPVVLAVHSGTGFPGYAATDRVHERLAAMVYVDTRPGRAPLQPDFPGAEMPLPPGGAAAEENLDGLSEEQLTTFRSGRCPSRRGAASRTGRADRTTPASTSHHGHLHGLTSAGVQGRDRREAMRGSPGWGAARHHLGRPADEPLADVVAPEGARRDHRRRREGPRFRRQLIPRDLGRVRSGGLGAASPLEPAALVRAAHRTRRGRGSA